MIKIENDEKESNNTMNLVSMFVDDLEVFFAPTLCSRIDVVLAEYGHLTYADKMGFLADLYSKIIDLTEKELVAFFRGLNSIRTVESCQK